MTYEIKDPENQALKIRIEELEDQLRISRMRVDVLIEDGNKMSAMIRGTASEDSAENRIEALEKKLERSERSKQATMSVVLLSAYHTANALREQTTLLGRNLHLLPETERNQVRSAIEPALHLYQAFNALVCDTGNDNGAEFTRSQNPKENT